MGYVDDWPEEAFACVKPPMEHRESARCAGASFGGGRAAADLAKQRGHGLAEAGAVPGSDGPLHCASAHPLRVHMRLARITVR